MPGPDHREVGQSVPDMSDIAASTVVKVIRLADMIPSAR